MGILLLWDLDGTLVHNQPASPELYLDAIEHVTGTRPTNEVAEADGLDDEQLIAELLRLNALDPRRLTDVQFRLDGMMRDQFVRGWDRDATRGALAALAAVTDRGWTNALLTGNVRDHARYKLLAAGIDPESFDWDRSYFGHDTPARVPVDPAAREPASGDASLFIGDAPSDALVAASSGIPFIAVATGRYSAAQLARTSAIAVVEDLLGGLETILAAVQSSLASDDAVESSPAPSGDAKSSVDPRESVAH